MIKFCFIGEEIRCLRWLAGGVAALWIVGLITCGYERLETSFSAVEESCEHLCEGSDRAVVAQGECSPYSTTGGSQNNEEEQACCSTTDVLGIDGKRSESFIIPDFLGLLIPMNDINHDLAWSNRSDLVILRRVNRSKVNPTPLLYLGPGIRSLAPPRS